MYIPVVFLLYFWGPLSPFQSLYYLRRQAGFLQDATVRSLQVWQGSRGANMCLNLTIYKGIGTLDFWFGGDV